MSNISFDIQIIRQIPANLINEKHMKTSTYRRSINTVFAKEEVLLLLVALFWGTSYGLTKSALFYTPVLLFIAIRFLATHFSLLYFTLQDFKAKRNPDWPVALPTGLLLLGIFCCEVYGVSLTSATNAAFLISLCIIFTAGLDALLSPNKRDKKLLYLAFMSVSGVLALTYNQTLNLSLNQGDILILCAAILRAVLVIFTQRLTKNKRITDLSLTSLQSLIVGLGALVLAFITLPGDTIALPTDMRFWLISLYLIVFCTLFAFYIQNYAVRRISATKVSLLMGSEPLFGALFAMVWLAESFSFIQILGGITILVSITLASKTTKNDH
jgi:drug/metabolite transporter (DMT)-like permease